MFVLLYALSGMSCLVSSFTVLYCCFVYIVFSHACSPDFLQHINNVISYCVITYCVSRVGVTSALVYVPCPCAHVCSCAQLCFAHFYDSFSVISVHVCLLMPAQLLLCSLSTSTLFVSILERVSGLIIMVSSETIKGISVT